MCVCGCVNLSRHPKHPVQREADLKEAIWRSLDGVKSLRAIEAGGDGRIKAIRGFDVQWDVRPPAPLKPVRGCVFNAGASKIGGIFSELPVRINLRSPVLLRILASV